MAICTVTIAILDANRLPNKAFDPPNDRLKTTYDVYGYKLPAKMDVFPASPCISKRQGYDRNG